MIDIKNLSFAYPKMAQPLFEQLDFHIPAGVICGMLGPNGAGKSTLLKILAGLIFPQQGKCEVLGYQPCQRHPDFLADIFLLPEEIFVPAVTANTYLTLHAAFYPKFSAASFQALMREFNLPPDKKLTTFSQGQKKKFLLAFGLATNTRLLIMDEPSNGLDIPGKSQFRKVLVSHYSEDRSFIISTHQVHDLDGLIDSVAIISDGRILLHDTLDSLSNQYAVSREYEEPADALYYEQGLDGYSVIRNNNSGMESAMDLSLLFGLITKASPSANPIQE